MIAAAIPNPTLGVQLGELSGNLNRGSNATGCNHNSNVSCGPAEYFSFSQLIEVAGKRGLRIQSSGFATQAAESDFRDAVRIFSNMVRDAYYELLQMQKNRWLAQEIVDHYRVISKANSLRLKSGDISESDFLRVKMEAMRAQSDLDNAQAAVELAQANLAVILRWPDKSLQFEAKELWPEVKDIGQNLPKEELISKALQQRPDLEADKIVQRFKDGLLDDARTVRDSSELAYSKGATSVLDFIEAQRNYKIVMRDYYAAMINRANAYYDLAKSLGMELNSDKTPVGRY